MAGGLGLPGARSRTAWLRSAAGRCEPALIAYSGAATHRVRHPASDFWSVATASETQGYRRPREDAPWRAGHRAAGARAGRIQGIATPAVPSVRTQSWAPSAPDWAPILAIPPPLRSLPGASPRPRHFLELGSVGRHPGEDLHDAERSGGLPTRVVASRSEGSRSDGGGRSQQSAARIAVETPVQAAGCHRTRAFGTWSLMSARDAALAQPGLPEHFHVS